MPIPKPYGPSRGGSIQCIATSAQLSAPLWFLYPSWFNESRPPNASFGAAPSYKRSGQLHTPSRAYSSRLQISVPPKAQARRASRARLSELARACPQQLSLGKPYATASTQISCQEEVRGQPGVDLDPGHGDAHVRPAHPEPGQGASWACTGVSGSGRNYDAGLTRRVRIPGPISVRKRRKVPIFRRGNHDVKRFGGWLGAFHMLNTHTPKSAGRAHRHRVVLMLPEELVDDLVTSFQNTIIDIAERFNCGVDLLESIYSNAGHRPLALFGSPHAIMLVRRAVEDAAQQVAGSMAKRIPALQTHALPLATVERIEGVKTVPRRPPKRWNDIVRPTTWTAVSFAAYVYHLCHCLPGPSTRLKASSSDQKEKARYENLVSDALLEVFSDPVARPAATTAALNEAIQFLQRYQMHQHARIILEDMTKLGLHMDADTFNIRLRLMAARGQTSDFVDELRKMIGEGISPNGDTWIAFLMATKPFSDRLCIMGAMQRHGLLRNVRIMQAAVGQVLSGHLTQWLDEKRDMEEYLLSIDRAMGDQWLSTSSANKILDQLGRRGLTSLSVELWETQFGRDISMDTVSMNTILSRCGCGPTAVSPEELFKWAVRVLRVAERRRIRADHITYKSLLWRAHGAQLYNVARVIWRYACMGGQVTYPMRSLALKSLWRGRSADPQAHNALWLITVGKVMVGIQYPEGFPPAPNSPRSLGGSEEASANAVSTVDEVELMAGLCGFKEKGEALVQARATLKAMWRRDLEAHELICPAKPFSKVLALALERDLEWARLAKDEKAAAEMDCGAWKVRNAVKVPTLPRLALKAHDGWIPLQPSSPPGPTTDMDDSQFMDPDPADDDVFRITGP